MSGAVSEPGLSKNPSKWLKKKCLKTSICTLDAKCECDSLESNKEIALQSLILQVLVWLGGGGGAGVRGGIGSLCPPPNKCL